MIHWCEGSIFDSTAECLVNPVNCEGVSGAGLALVFRNKFRSNAEWYHTLCNYYHQGEIGRVHMYKVPYTRGTTKYIANFPTKLLWDKPSTLDYIRKGLIDLVHQLVRYDIKSCAVPALGCGLGGLQWPDVRMLLVYYVQGLYNEITALSGYELYVYPPIDKFS